MVGSALKRLRQIKKMTQDTLARKLGVTRQAICMWETDRRELKASTLSRISDILNVPISKIMHRQDAKTGKETIAMAEKKQIIKKKRVAFELNAPRAQKVMLAGDFNLWDADSIPLKKDKKGFWKVTTSLKTGRYEYKFVVDGDWQNDPSNSECVNNVYGGINSVKTVTS